MEIKKINGGIIINTDNDNIKDAIEDAVQRGADLYGADLYGADLSGAELHGANLKGANLGDADISGANLYSADLSGADLSEADLSGANLKVAHLYGADLSGSDLSGANLSDAFLSGANLSDADISGADLKGAYLSGAKNIPFIPIACPSDGEFTGWKKVYGTLIELRIPADAKRSSSTTYKCRCDKALVLSITDIKTGDKLTEIVNHNYGDTIYRVGETVYPDSFDEDRWKECSHGIFFFTNKDSAINY